MTGESLVKASASITTTTADETTKVIAGLPSPVPAADGKTIHSSITCTTFAEGCSFTSTLGDLFHHSSSWSATVPTHDVDDYVFWRYSIDTENWHTWSDAATLTFTTAESTVYVEAWTHCGQAYQDSFKVVLHPHSSHNACAAFTSMWTENSPSPQADVEAHKCAYPGSDFVMMTFAYDSESGAIHDTSTVKGKYTDVKCYVKLAEGGALSQVTETELPLAWPSSPSGRIQISKQLAFELAHDPETAQNTDVAVRCDFTFSFFNSGLTKVEPCPHTFTITDCNDPGLAEPGTEVLTLTSIREKKEEKKKEDGERNEVSGTSNAGEVKWNAYRGFGAFRFVVRAADFDEPMDYSDAKEDDEEDNLEEKEAMPELSEAAAVSAGRSGGVRSLARNLTEELNEVAGPEPANGYDEDESDDHRSSAMVEDANSRPNGGRPPLNGDTPAANRVLGRYLELMKVKSNWMRSFAPEVVRQAIWMELGGELTVPMESWNTRQVAEDTVQLLRAMGCEPQAFPSEADLRAWAPEDAATALRKWKQKLRSAFGVAEAGVSRPPNVRHASDPVDPSMIPLPLTPGRRPRGSTEAGVFSAQGATSTYFQDSHMVTPRSVRRTERLAREAEGYRTAPTAGRSASRTL
uniref:Uncharacterized protein n=2 Tax=Phytophthora ramorum TaxID=164328 RepID=H3GF90_PHYRM